MKIKLKVAYGVFGLSMALTVAIVAYLWWQLFIVAPLSALGLVGGLIFIVAFLWSLSVIAERA